MLHHLVNDVLIGFRHAYPEIMLDIVVSNQRLNLSKRDADVAVRATYQPPDTLAGQRLARIAWAVFGPAALASKGFDPATDGRRHDWIAFTDLVSVAKVMKWLKSHVDEARIVYKVNTMLGLAEAAAGGVGVVLLPCYVGRRDPGAGAIEPTAPRARRRALADHAPGPAQYGARARVSRLLRRRHRQAARDDRRQDRGARTQEPGRTILNGAVHSPVLDPWSLSSVGRRIASDRDVSGRGLTLATTLRRVKSQ